MPTSIGWIADERVLEALWPMAGPEDVTVEKFAPNGGQVVAGIGALVVAGHDRRLGDRP